MRTSTTPPTMRSRRCTRGSVGGYVIIDDYDAVIECREAVHDFLEATRTEAHLQPIDTDAVFWLKRP